jgi:hypothetical protein
VGRAGFQLLEEMGSSLTSQMQLIVAKVSWFLGLCDELFL